MKRNDADRTIWSTASLFDYVGRPFCFRPLLKACLPRVAGFECCKCSLSLSLCLLLRAMRSPGTAQRLRLQQSQTIAERSTMAAPVPPPPCLCASRAPVFTPTLQTAWGAVLSSFSQMSKTSENPTHADAFGEAFVVFHADTNL